MSESISNFTNDEDQNKQGDQEKNKNLVLHSQVNQKNLQNNEETHNDFTKVNKYHL